MKDKCFKVRVPATSANMGPGFDSLGIAFQLFNEYISLGYNLSLELDDSFEYTENNLIWLSIFKYVLGNSELIPQDKLIER